MNATATASEYGVHADQNRWLGIDFSGDKRKWSAGCSKSNVWIADIRPLNDVVQLVDLRRVQELLGDGSPFELLASLLAKRSFLAAAIDAPFSVPKLISCQTVVIRHYWTSSRNFRSTRRSRMLRPSQTRLSKVGKWQSRNRSEKQKECGKKEA